MSTMLFKENSFVELSQSKYDLTVKIIKIILQSTLKKQFPKESKGEKVLELILRFYRKDGMNKIMMSKEFVGSVFWKDIEFWVNIFCLSHERDLAQSQLNNSKIQKGKGIRGFFSNFISKTINSNAAQIKEKIEMVNLGILN
jgi:hypothetical protein